MSFIEASNGRIVSVLNGHIDEDGQSSEIGGSVDEVVDQSHTAEDESVEGERTRKDEDIDNDNQIPETDGLHDSVDDLEDDSTPDDKASAMATLKRIWNVDSISDMFADGTWLRIVPKNDYELEIWQEFAVLARAAEGKMSRDQIIQWIRELWVPRQKNGKLVGIDWAMRQKNLREYIRTIIDALNLDDWDRKIDEWKDADKKSLPKKGESNVSTTRTRAGNQTRSKSQATQAQSSEIGRKFKSASSQHFDPEVEARANAAVLERIQRKRNQDAAADTMEDSGAQRRKKPRTDAIPRSQSTSTPQPQQDTPDAAREQGAHDPTPPATVPATPLSPGTRALSMNLYNAFIGLRNASDELQRASADLQVARAAATGPQTGANPTGNVAGVQDAQARVTNAQRSVDTWNRVIWELQNRTI